MIEINEATPMISGVLTIRSGYAVFLQASLIRSIAFVRFSISGSVITSVLAVSSSAMAAMDSSLDKYSPPLTHHIKCGENIAAAAKRIVR